MANGTPIGSFRSFGNEHWHSGADGILSVLNRIDAE
jgi:hypothetical protein